MILMENGEVESEDEQEDKEDLGPIFDDEDESFGYPHHGPLLVARKGMVESIFDETNGRLVDVSDPAVDDEVSIDGPIGTSTDTPLPTSTDSQLRTSIDGF
ncbi:hypothetical protein F2Q70_00017725 [Brassica cretica]|uniref:Uncharacterized protein n=1 Tax=Brassica cretica TaxID=69181 RepID=A0A8S9I6N7_BRACR|nr:hypothetical protein F2Q70_00017725 [Brassica cretica]